MKLWKTTNSLRDYLNAAFFSPQRSQSALRAGMSLSSVRPIGTGPGPASKRAASLRLILHPAITIKPF